MATAASLTPNALPHALAQTAPPRDEPRTINILLTSFAGLGLPRTLSLPISSHTTVADALRAIHARLPPVEHPLIITTTSNKQLLHTTNAPLSSLLPNAEDTFLPLRLSSRLCGGKGGFGSQLRAAGGRMSSRKNHNQQQNPNGSNRNLDGRRLRTVDEAKRLAEYLAIKPEMERKEKEERQKRWQAVVEAAERREEEIKAGGKDKGRLDAEYVEAKEAAEEKTREAVLKAMREGMMELERTGSESSVDADENADSQDDPAQESSGSSGGLKEESGMSFFGWDDDEEEDDTDEDEDEDEIDEESVPQPLSVQAYEGKGKAKIH